jgi:hypothetical protein
MADPAGRVYLQVLVVRCQVGDRQAFAELVARTLSAGAHAANQSLRDKRREQQRAGGEKRRSKNRRRGD